ncbi:TIGR02646 family protein [Vibrio parahaemolyticus]|uniref:retron system putative HNH endonuclease n=2 Tax=Vibrio parahaemolyticus TaxID=670 RepID=UPI0004D7F602|nr:retron system putative HNH endonuclease [Vibrio parahaemolyticus]ELB2743451.1 TIGR02646 family protein [Vibrio parahaemolyticus]MBM5044048.1 TIGR02646 family protein [Vibrio parahaemolyticus]MBM5051997.1 TIGR02646 family protein [Vibrio parahaemolyticus]MDG3052504.1 TIGR02646 family protein [Vibrio parahaemolyticus]ODY24200.1 TIGR02646 family protein [Vibrio parahaemolyticus]
MIPLRHGAQPEELKEFLRENTEIQVQDFDSAKFQPIKVKIKETLLQLQNNQCVYCERTFSDINSMQVEHIKPKSGKNAHPDLCFTYTNYAASCIQNTEKSKRTCGQNKSDKIIEIEPTSPDCNQMFMLNTEGEIHPISNITKRQKHTVRSTVGTLGLNKPHLTLLRKKRIKNLISIIGLNPKAAKDYICSGDFPHILFKLDPK